LEKVEWQDQNLSSEAVEETKGGTLQSSPRNTVPIAMKAL
jgi:hypothetical protein